MIRQARFQRLLGWYPQNWRLRNGDVLLATMLDDAERSGRDAPTAAERFSVIGHGLGFRMDRRCALVAVILSLTVAATAGVLTAWALPSAVLGPWVLPALTIFLGPALVVAAGTAFARERGLLTEPRAVVSLAVSLLALAAAGLAQVAWTVAFDAANRGLPMPGFADAWPWLFAGAWVFGAAAIAIFVDAPLRRSRVPHSAAVAVSLVAGALLAPLVGLSLIHPYTVAAAAVAMALAIVASRRTTTPIGGLPDLPRIAAANAIPRRTRTATRTLAVISALTAGLGVVYALTGAQWSGAGDQTEVMSQGLSVSLIGAVPLIAAIGISAIARPRTRPLHIWGPLTLAIMAFGSVCIAYRGAPAWESMAPGLAVSSIFGGVAIAWWLAPRLPGRPRMRGAVAALVGVVYAAYLGLFIAPMLAFCLPLLAVAVAIWTPGREHHRGTFTRIPSPSADPLLTSS